MSIQPLETSNNNKKLCFFNGHDTEDLLFLLKSGLHVIVTFFTAHVKEKGQIFLGGKINSPADLSVGEDMAIEVRLELNFTLELTAIDDTGIIGVSTKQIS
jgi:hypothetical protein